MQNKDALYTYGVDDMLHFVFLKLVNTLLEETCLCLDFVLYSIHV